MSSPVGRRFIGALFPPWTASLHRSLVAVGAACAVAAVALAAIVKSHPYLAVDDSVARSIQSVDWGPLAATFPVFSVLGGPGGGVYMQAGAILLVLLLNRRAWLLALAAVVGGVWYPLIVNLVHRPRPTPAEVIHITEHPGATSFPSGHVIYITLTAGLLMLCLGYRYLPKRARPAGWVVVTLIAVAAAISRVYVGTHWPTDVLASLFIAGGWLALVSAFRWVSDRAFAGSVPAPQQALPPRGRE